ncbi:MAG: hypothetical protein WCX61_01100 [Candidatus Peribacteraceae bacterium]
MKAVVSDFDGILIESEAAKAIGWYAAVKRLKGDLTDEDVENIIALNDRGQNMVNVIIEELKSEQNSVLPKEVESMHRLYRREEGEDKMSKLGIEGIKSELKGKSDMDLALWCAGGTTEDFRDNIWNVFLAEAEGFRDLTQKQREEKLRELLGYRTDLKAPFMILGAKPIEGNQRFFGRLFDVLGTDKVALVNQSTSESIKNLFDIGSHWSTEPRIPTAFGEYNPRKEDPCYGFPRTFNVGDKKLNDKTDAYKKACEVMGMEPSETMTFEDTTSGIEAAIRANVSIIIGFNLAESTQNLSNAHYVVGNTLEKISSITTGLNDKTPEQVRRELDVLAGESVIGKN